MAKDDVAKMRVVAILDTVEKDHAPECVEENNTKCESCTGHEEEVGSALQTHRAWAICIGQDVYALEQLKLYNHKYTM